MIFALFLLKNQKNEQNFKFICKKTLIIRK
jgi:hypothetical protein